jgi:hypothetical protein
MKKEELRRIEYALVSEKEFKAMSPLEKTKASAQVLKKQGYFHGWATDTQFMESSIEGQPLIVHATHAIIEQQDGTVIKVKPENIRFL